MFKPGDKVKCIDVKPRRKKGLHAGLHKDEIYTVTSCFDGIKTGLQCIRLEEINPKPTGGFYADRFVLAEGDNVGECSLALKMLRDLLKEGA